MERSFQTAQDRLGKGLRVARAKTLEEADAYLETEFIPWWNQTLTVTPASADDAHRPLGKQHSLAASLSYVETRRVNNDYTIQVDNRTYQIARNDIRAGLRGADVRVEVRLDRSLTVRFGEHYLSIAECLPRPKALKRKTAPRKPAAPRAKSQWMNNFRFPSQEKTALLAAAALPQATNLNPIR